MSRREIPPCSKTYGFPLYCASWVPVEVIAAKAAATSAAGEGEEEKEAEEKAEGGGEGSETAGGGESASEGSSGLEEVASNELMLVLGGGGGEGRSGVPNALLLARFDQTSRSLSEEPVSANLAPSPRENVLFRALLATFPMLIFVQFRLFNSWKIQLNCQLIDLLIDFVIIFFLRDPVWQVHRLGTGQDVPYRMALHPKGDGILCSFPNGCRFVPLPPPLSLHSYLYIPSLIFSFVVYISSDKHLLLEHARLSYGGIMLTVLKNHGIIETLSSIWTNLHLPLQLKSP